MSFKRFDQEDITISADSIVAPAWTGQVTNLTSFHTGSQTVLESGKYYYNIYQTGSNDPAAEVQFSIAYGNSVGSGSLPISGIAGKSPSSIVYGQYRTLVNGDENNNFIFGNITPKSIYALSISRARFKEKLLPASFNLTLTSGSNTLRLTDNSLDSSTVSYLDVGRVYDIVSGSNGTAYLGTGFHPSSGSYGKFLPDVGIVLLNGDAFKDPSAYGLNLNINEASAVDGQNQKPLYNAIVAGGNFLLRSEETVSSNYIFVRVRNSEYNYSTNPSNIVGSGELRHSIMVNSPQAYITTVGLYNDNNDLLGVAKLSRPLLKDFTKETLLRIKLDY